MINDGYVGPTDKIYVITRRDLSPGMQLVQSCHALVKHSTELPRSVWEWEKNSGYLCCLSVKNEKELRDFWKQWDKEIAITPFFESDLNDELTALALEPGPVSKLATKKLQLALKENKKTKSMI